MRTINPFGNYVNASEAFEALRENKEVYYRLKSTPDWKKVSENTPLSTLLDSGSYEYCIPLSVKRVAGIYFPEPLTSLPEGVTEVYVPAFSHALPCCLIQNRFLVQQAIERGVAHLSEENAMAHAEALIAITAKGE